MAIDPNIALGYKGVDIPNQLSQFAQVQQLQANEMKMQESQAANQERNALRQLNPAAPDYENQLFKVNPQLGIQFRKERAAAEASQATASQHKAEAAVKRAAFIAQGERDMARNPSNANITAWSEDIQANDLFTPQEKAAAQAQASSYLAMPVEKRAAAMQMRGATPSDYTARGQLGVAQGHLKVAQDRLALDNTHLDPAENAAISKAILDGRIDPYKVNGKNAKIMAQTLMTNPNANIKDLGIEAAGATAAEKAISGQSAKMSTAANEATQMIGVVRNLSDRIDRTEYPSINAIQNAVDKGTGGKEIVQLNTSINALVNSYARAISPTGQPTVSDKNHAREILNAAYSNGQIGAILDTMNQEMTIAKSSAGETRAQLKAERTGAKPTNSSAGLSPAEQSELDQLRARFKK